MGWSKKGGNVFQVVRAARAKAMEKAAKDVVKGMKEARMAHTARAPQLSIRRKIGPERPAAPAHAGPRLMIRVWDFLETVRELLKV